MDKRGCRTFLRSANRIEQLLLLKRKLVLSELSFVCESHFRLDFFENICHVFFLNSTGKFSVSLVFQVRRPDVFDWEEEKRKKQGFWGNSNKKDRNGPQF